MPERVFGLTSAMLHESIAVVRDANGERVPRAATIAVAADVYAKLSGRARRVAALRAMTAKVPAGARILLPVRLSDEHGLPGHLAVDVSRRLLSFCGVAVAEEGDRVDGTHRFFRAEEIVSEALEAGWAVTALLHGSYQLEPVSPRVRPCLPPARALQVQEFLRILSHLRRVTVWLETLEPLAMFSNARALGLTCLRRDLAARRALRWGIAWVDSFAPGRRGCLRRTVLEVSLDRGAAEETILLGLDLRSTGHAWLESSANEQRLYDVAFRIEPEPKSSKAASRDLGNRVENAP